MDKVPGFVWCLAGLALLLVVLLLVGVKFKMLTGQ